MNLFSNFANSLKTGVGQQMSPSYIAPPVKKPLVTSNPSAVSPAPVVTPPAVKSPAGQAFVQSQLPKKEVATTGTQNTTGTTVTPYTGYTASKDTPTVTTTQVKPETTPTYGGSPQNENSYNPNATARDTYISAYKNYINTQADNSATTEAKKYLNKLILDDQMAQEKARNSGETMGFAGGEQARVARNNSFSIDAATNNLNALTLDQANKLGVAKTGLDFAKDLGTMDSEASKAAYQKEKDTADRELANKKFEEDKRQYGLDYALKAREVRVKEQEAAAKTGDTATANATKESEALSSMNLINTLLENKSVGSITGPVIGRGLFGLDPLKVANLNPSGDAQLAKNQFNQIKGILALENRSKLKGQGAVSDFEGKTLDRAASSLDTNLSTDDFKDQLTQIKGSIATSHGLNADVLLYDPATKTSQVVNTNSAGIATAVKDGLIVKYK